MFSIRRLAAGGLPQRLPAGPLVALLFALAAPGAAAQDTTTPGDGPAEIAGPPAPPSAKPGAESAAGDRSGETLTNDMDSAIVGVVAHLLAVPRFEDQVDVGDRYRDALDAQLRAAELECKPTPSSGPPTQDELNRYGANPRPASADLLTPGKLLFGKLKGLLSREEPRFFLYSVRREDEPERVVYLVLDSPIAASARESVPGTAWELLARYSDRAEATDALESLERGDPARPGEGQGTPRTLWAATGCRS